jgi:hypothetical protein
MRTVIPLPAVAGEECVEILMRLGFLVVARPDGATVLRLKGRVVIVPAVGILDSDVLEIILCDAGLSRLRFLEALSEPQASSSVPAPARSGVRFKRRSRDVG